jgi:ribosome recycling factor
MEPLIKEIEASLKDIIGRFTEELQSVRSNRPSVQLVENIPVDSYGQQMTIKQMGSLSIRPPRDIEISVWDKSVMPAVMKALQDSGAGLSVTNDGTTIRASLPTLTSERREEFAKLVKKMSEQWKIQIRSRRDDIMKKVNAAEEEGGLGEDQVFKGKEKIQKAVEEANKKIDALLEGKLVEFAE